MIRWPGKYKAGLRCDAMVEIGRPRADAARSRRDPGPFRNAGTPLTPLLTGKTTKHRDSIYCEHFDSSFLVRSATDGSRACRTERYKLAYYRNLGAGELYDFQKDPVRAQSLGIIQREGCP